VTSPDPINEAQRVRYLAEMRQGPIDDIVVFAEDHCGIDVTIDLFPAAFAGMLFVDLGRSFIFVNGADPPPRQRFTIAHELGHHLLGHGPRTDVGSFYDSSDQREIDANKFASELLLPYRDALEYWGGGARPPGEAEAVQKLAGLYGLSFTMVRYHLQNADIIGRRTADALAAVDRDWRRRAEIRRLVDVPVVDDTVEGAKGMLPRIPPRVELQGRRLDQTRFARNAFQQRTGVGNDVLDRLLPRTPMPADDL
jgi:Zn-dependent peptidase ImmA (M78 family)